MGQFEPIHDAHAIEQMALSAQFAAPLDGAGLAAVFGAAEQFSGELPGRADLQAIAFGFTAGAMLPPMPTSGRLLVRTRTNGTVESELRIETGSVSFRSTAYTRWDQVWGHAQRYFNTLLPIYLERSGLSAISLNFLDKFYWVGETSEMRPKALLRRGSEYVVPGVFEEADLWHSYTGSFARTDEFVKRLVNINLDCLDESHVQSGQSRRVVGITTVITDMLNQPGYSAFSAKGSDAIGFFQQQVSELHAVSKSKLMAIIDDRMCKRIGLEAGA